MTTRVLFLAPSCSIYGGVARWLVDMNLALSARGLHCVTGVAEGATFHDSAKFRQAYPEVDYLVLDGRTGSPAGRREAVARAIRRTRPDVVVPVMLADGLEAAVQEKARTGFHIVYPVHEVNPGVTRDLRRYAAWLDAVVFADRSSHDHHVAQCPSVQDRAQVIPCGVPSATVARTPAVPGVVRLGFCGRLEEAQKRVLDLVGLCRSLAQRDVQFELIVAGEGSSEAALRAALDAMQPRPACRFLGSIAREALYRDFYPRVDQVVICSAAETGPLVAFEAMVHGCVVITSDFAGRAENRVLLDGATCLVFPVGDMRQAAALVQRAAQAPELALSIAARARSAATAERSLAASAERWCALIETLLRAPRVASGQGLPVRRSGGFLASLGLPEQAAELLRRAARRRFPHATAGEEWPQYCAEG